jgi:hypothetical protein
MGYSENCNRGCEAAITWELKEEKDGPEFSMCAEIWQPNHSDVIRCGQCVDDVVKYFPKNKKAQRMAEIWERYHLNDMNAACEHQRALGWGEMASQEVKIYTWKLQSWVTREQKCYEEKAVEVLRTGKPYTPDANGIKLCALPYEIKTIYSTLSEDESKYYEAPIDSTYCHHVETKTLGWLHQEEHPDGILCRPCPTCGYKYGTAWLKEQIPPEIVAEIRSW